MRLTKTYWIVAVMALAAPGLRAGTITATLDNPFVVAKPGDVVPFNATLSVSTGENTATVFLNFDNSYVDSPLAIDDGGFFATFPPSFDPGDSIDGMLFTITVPAEALDGIYTGTFGIFGGDSAGGQDQLASLAFNVQVGQEVPEPGGLELAAVGLMALITGVLGRALRVARR